MSSVNGDRLRGLLRREFAEHRTILLLTPALMVLAQVLIVVLGMFAADQILTTNLDKVAAWVASNDIDVSIDVTVDQPVDVGNSIAVGKQPLPGATGPVGGNTPSAAQAGSVLAVLLPLVHMLFVGVLILISTIYLLGTLYNDRRDRSILFFKSMPVAEWQELGSKLLIAILLAPVIYLLASWFTQGILWLLLGAGASEGAGAGVEPYRLFELCLRQGIALLIGLLWVVPFYSWLLLASAAASRSPVLIAIWTATKARFVMAVGGLACSCGYVGGDSLAAEISLRVVVRRPSLRRLSG